MQKLLNILSYLAVAVLVGYTISYAGSLTPPGSVADTMYSLTDIFNLSTGTTTTEDSGTIPSTPGTVTASGKSLTEVYTAIAGEIDNLTNGRIASGISAFGFTGTLYGDTDASKVLTTATYPGTATAGGLPATGQTACSNADGSAQSPCLDGSNTDGGQDAYYLAGTALSYTDNGDGTVTDNTTGLMWKKCSQGKTGATCATGALSFVNQRTALASCEADTTGGYTDWRLPNIKELFSIVDFGRIYPAANPVFDFSSGGGVQYWSSTSYQDPDYDDYALYVDFDDGTEYDGRLKLGGGILNIRCVRSN